MTGLRNLISLKGPRALVLLLAVLGMHALVPVGHMVAASPGHGLAVTMCPVTHPLARAAIEAEARAPAMDHAAMGHGDGATGGIDHAAMGHVPDGPDDATPVTAQGDQDCAFSALGSSAIDPGKLSLDPLIRDGTQADIAPLPELAVVEADRLRPPLRAPPRLS